jgi:hypothetical protein
MDSVLLGELTKFNSTKILLIGDFWAIIIDEVVQLPTLLLLDSDDVSHGSGKWNTIFGEQLEP